MVDVGDPQEERRWVFQYRRCARYGFTIRRSFREIPDEARLTKLRRTLAHSFIRRRGDAE